MSRQLTSGVLGRKKGKLIPWYTDDEIFSFIAEGYLPVSNRNDLNALGSQTAVPRTWAIGSKFQVDDREGGPGNYIMINDIDLSDDNWSSIVNWGGILDGGGHIVKNMYINKPTSIREGLFSNSTDVFTIKNLALLNAYVNSRDKSAIIVGGPSDSNTIENCIVQGIINVTTSVGEQGGIIGLNASDTSNISNVISSVMNINTAGGQSLGGIVGRNTGTQNVLNSYVLGHYYTSYTGTRISAVIGRDGNTVTNVYRDSDIVNYVRGGVPKTTNELITGEPSVDIFTEWDANVWQFETGKYPILKPFGELAINRPAPVNVQLSETGGDVTITWDEPVLKPVGYHIYRMINNGIPAKIASVGDLIYIDESLASNSYEYYVTAEYNINNRISETSNSTVKSITL